MTSVESVIFLNAPLPLHSFCPQATHGGQLPLKYNIGRMSFVPTIYSPYFFLKLFYFVASITKIISSRFKLQQVHLHFKTFQTQQNLIWLLHPKRDFVIDQPHFQRMWMKLRHRELSFFRLLTFHHELEISSEIVNISTMQ